MTAEGMEDEETPAAGASDTQVAMIGRHAGRGLAWALLGTLATKIGSFAMSLVLVRLLAPHDFGLYAIALAATAFAIHVNDMGVIAATVQWRGRIDDMLPTGATVALAFSIAWYAIFWFAAPPFSELAGSPDATPIVRILTATIVIDGITAVRVGLIQRRFQQDKLIQAITAGFVGNAAVAILLAANGAGAYSFVVGALVQSVITGIIVLKVARVPFTYGFDREVFKRLMKFGTPLAAGLAVESVLLFSDSVVVGNVLGATLLGFYLLAFNVSSWVPGLVNAAVRYVSIPSFSRLAEQDRDAFNTGVRRAIQTMFTFVLPILVTMAVLAPYLIGFLYGSEWLPASAALRFLAIVVIARMLTALSFDILTSLGVTSATAWTNLGWAIALVPALIVGAHVGGIQGAAMAHAGVALVVAIPLTVLVLHRGGVSLRPVAPALVRPLVGGLVAGLIMALLALILGQKTSAFVVLAVAGGVGLAVYVAIAVRGAHFRKLVSKGRELANRGRNREAVSGEII